MQSDNKADLFFFGPKDGAAKKDSLLTLLKNYQVVVIGLHNYSRRPANNFGLSEQTIQLLQQAQTLHSINFVFGNPYAMRFLCDARNVVACYEDDAITQLAAIDFLQSPYQLKVQLCYF